MVLSKLLDSQDDLSLFALKMLKLKKNIIKKLTFQEWTIADLCKETEFSIPTVTKIISELIEDGLVFEKGKIGTAGGRRPSVYGINPNSAFFMGVDIKRHFINMGLQNFNNEFVKVTTRIPYSIENTPESLFQLCDMINKFIEDSGVNREKVLGTCIAFIGRINSKLGCSKTYFSFEDSSLAKIIEERIHTKTFIENDSRAQIYGEYCKGIVNGERNILYMNLNYGFGIGIMCNGELYYGTSGFSGEFGHSPILDNEIICECGKKGCLQTEISGQTLIRRFKEKLSEGSTSMLSSMVDVNHLTMYDIIEAAVKHEDLLAIEVIAEVGEKLGRYLSLLINVFNPDLIIIGGELAVAGSYIKLPIQTALHKYSLNILLQDMSLKVAKLGNKAGVIGACHILRDRLFNLF